MPPAGLKRDLHLCFAHSLALREPLRHSQRYSTGLSNLFVGKPHRRIERKSSCHNTVHAEPTLSAWLPGSHASTAGASQQLQLDSFQEPISASVQPRVLIFGHTAQEILKHVTEECHICNILVLLSPDQPEAKDLSVEPSISTLGNELGVRCWRGNLASVPAFQGPFDVIYLTQAARNTVDPYDALLQSSLRLKPGGVIIAYCTAEDGPASAVAACGVASDRDLLQLAWQLPLNNVTPSSSSGALPQPKIIMLQKPKGFARSGLPLELEGPVVEGFGRGSKQLGFPTANLDPAPLQAALASFPTGVYWGYASVSPDSSSDATGAALAVVNIGRRPTYGDSPAISIEAHVLKQFPEDFYGKPMQLTLHGFIRPEIKFSGLQELVDQIKMDIGAAKAAAAP